MENSNLDENPAKVAKEVTLLPPTDRLQITIIIISVVVPVLVAVLLYLPKSARAVDLDVQFLPKLNAILNSATAFLLVLGLVFIKMGNWRAHRSVMLSAILLSAFFLISYVIYHYAAPSTLYGDLNHNGLLDETERNAVAQSRPWYLVLLLSHIALATIIVPFVLFTAYYSLTGRLQKHKKLARYTWPMWFYVAVTGVVVYWMISPYYPY